MSQASNNGYGAIQAHTDEASAKQARATAFDPRDGQDVDTTEEKQKTGQRPDRAAEEQSADLIDPNDPHKVEKLSKLGQAGDEAAEGTE